MTTMLTESQLASQADPAVTAPAPVAPQAPAKAPARKPAAPRARSRAVPEKEHKVLAQPGFVLHSYPYKETSLIIDVFSRDHGRVALAASPRCAR
jgi:DNA repair protein RecO (recombination protein O)